MMGHRMKTSTVVLALSMVVWMAKEGGAEKHVVGGSEGWEASTDLASWASSKTFKVGDQLVFNYSSMHSVSELADESAYKKCDIGAALDSKATGNDVVKLNKAGTRYFACATFGHCHQGMKVTIKVVAGTAPSSTATASAASSHRYSSFAFIVFLALTSLLF